MGEPPKHNEEAKAEKSHGLPDTLSHSLDVLQTEELLGSPAKVCTSPARDTYINFAPEPLLTQAAYVPKLSPTRQRAGEKARMFVVSQQPTQ